MRVVHKFPIRTDRDATEIIVSPEATVLYCGLDPRGQICLWVEVDATDGPEAEDRKLERRAYRLFGTGEPVVGPADRYVGTVVQGMFVWHVYELGI